MTISLRTSLWQVDRYTLLADTIKIESLGILKHSEEFRYDRIVSRSVKERRSPVTAILIFGILACIPIGFGYLAEFFSVPSWHIATVLFAIPALMALREVARSRKHELLFLEKGDGGVAIRFGFTRKEAAEVEPFVRELKVRISQARKK